MKEMDPIGWAASTNAIEGATVLNRDAARRTRT